MRITNLLNAERIYGYIATALDTTTTSIEVYQVLYKYHEEFSDYSFKIIKRASDTRFIQVVLRLTSREILQHCNGRNEAEQVQNLERWLDTYVFRMVEQCIFTIQAKETEMDF